ncbi:hypothetical protein Hte_007915 [Hypoxylon texense]
MINRHSLTEVKNSSLKRRGTFYHVPNQDVIYKRQAIWRPVGPSLPVSRKEASTDEYLRAKWPCSDAMPEAFDPDKLEVIRRTWSESQSQNELVKAYTKAAREEEEREKEKENNNNNGRQNLSTKRSYYNDHDEVDYDNGPRAMYSQGKNSSSESVCTGVSITESLLESEELDGYDSEVTVETASRASIISRTSITRVSLHSPPACTPDAAEIISMRSPEPVLPDMYERERGTRPRMGIGSRPPLSRSAFSIAGMPHPQNEYQGRPRSETLKAYPRAPGYFPFRSTLRL